MKIGISGSSFFGKVLVRNLRNAGIDASLIELSLFRLTALKNALSKDIIHFVWSPTVSFSGLIMVIILKLLFRRKVIISWIGTDILLAKTFKGFVCSKIGSKFVDLNLTLTKWLAEELKESRISSVICPLPLYRDVSVSLSLPDRFTVLIFLPTRRFEFYGGEVCEKIIDSFKDVRFIIVANDGGGLEERKENVQFLGWVDNMDEVYSQTTVLVRMPKHDGLSNMVLEALSAGRYVIYSYPLEGCFYARTYEDVRKSLNKLLNTPLLKPNVEGRNVFLREYSKGILINRLLSLYNFLMHA